MLRLLRVSGRIVPYSALAQSGTTSVFPSCSAIQRAVWKTSKQFVSLPNDAKSRKFPVASWMKIQPREADKVCQMLHGRAEPFSLCRWLLKVEVWNALAWIYVNLPIVQIAPTNCNIVIIHRSRDHRRRGTDSSLRPLPIPVGSYSTVAKKVLDFYKRNFSKPVM